MCFLPNTHMQMLFRRTYTFPASLFASYLTLPASYIWVNLSTILFIDSTFSLVLIVFFLFYFLSSRYHNYLHKELRFLPFPEHFLLRKNKALSKESLDELTRKTAFFLWHFGKPAQVVWPTCFYCLHLSLLYAFWLLLL